MILPSDAVIAGHPIRDVRKALQDIDGFGGIAFGYYERLLRRRVRLNANWREEHKEASRQAADMWDSLIREGLLVPYDEAHAEGYYRLSSEALAIRQATLGNGYHRKTATKALEGFLERCRTLEGPDCVYPYTVEYAVVYGSYCEGEERIGDVDICVGLNAKDDAFEDPHYPFKRFYEYMSACGRHVPYWNLSWPYGQTIRFLRARKQVLSLIGNPEGHLPFALAGPHEVVYGVVPASLRRRCAQSASPA